MVLLGCITRRNRLYCIRGYAGDLSRFVCIRVPIAQARAGFVPKLVRSLIGEARGSTPEEMAKVIADDSERWRGLATELGLKVTQ